MPLPSGPIKIKLIVIVGVYLLGRVMKRKLAEVPLGKSSPSTLLAMQLDAY